MSKSPRVRGEPATAKPAGRWEVVFDDAFRMTEWKAMDVEQRKALLAATLALRMAGPGAGRPLIGTLNNPLHPNMKELRYDAHGGTEVWRAAFAFDPLRKAVVLFAGDKQGMDEALFYRELLRKANKRYEKHLAGLKATSIQEEPRKAATRGKTRSGR